jgi:hypothetical protein
MKVTVEQTTKGVDIYLLPALLLYFGREATRGHIVYIDVELRIGVWGIRLTWWL